MILTDQPAPKDAPAYPGLTALFVRALCRAGLDEDIARTLDGDPRATVHILNFVLCADSALQDVARNPERAQ